MIYQNEKGQQHRANKSVSGEEQRKQRTGKRLSEQFTRAETGMDKSTLNAEARRRGGG